MNLFSFLSHFLNETNCSPTNNYEGKGLKHYGCELFSAIVHFTAKQPDTRMKYTLINYTNIKISSLTNKIKS